jgi:hypothetical protein
MGLEARGFMLAFVWERMLQENLTKVEWVRSAAVAFGGGRREVVL